MPVLSLKGTVTLILSDMKVTREHHDGWTLQKDLLYSIHTVGLYIIISVPSSGITLTWDKHTRITIELHPQWRVSDEDSDHTGFSKHLLNSYIPRECHHVSLSRPPPIFQSKVCGLCGNFDSNEMNDLQLSDSAGTVGRCFP